MKLDEIARLAGVSRTTASYVINGKSSQYRISPKTQQRVMDIVEKHNYRPNHTASALRAGSSRTFGLIIPDLENASYAKIAKKLERNARDVGFQLIISCSDDDPATEKQVVSALVSRKLDALVVASCLSADNDFYPAIQAAGTPIIAIDRGMNDEVFANVISEDQEGAFLLTEQLIAESTNGSLGLIGAMKDLGISKERERGFLAAAQKAGARVQIAYGEQFDKTSGEKIIERWLEEDTLPDAILTTSFTLCEGILDVFVQQPERLKNVKFATFGDSRILDFLPIKVQSLPQQFEDIAEQALALALNASAGRYQPGVEVVRREPVWRR